MTTTTLRASVAGASATVRIGWLFALAATLIYSTNAPVARQAILAGLEPTTLVLARSLIGVALFGLMLLLTNVARPQGDQRPFDRPGLLIGLLVGALNGLTLLCFNWGLVRLSASVATLLSIALAPIFTLLLLRLGGEAFTPRTLLRLAVSLAGLYFLVGFSGYADMQGVMLTTLGSFLYALHIVFMQWWLRPYNTWAVTSTMIIAGTIPALGLWWVNGASLYVPGAVGWTAILVQGVAAGFIARIFIYSALNAIGSAQIALLSPLEAALTVLWSILWLNEVIDGQQWLGMGLILFSTLLAASLHKRKRLTDS
jgi:drug/metabolite transporter (DMT)-like permease